jgi:hypothetical protein
MLVFYCSNLMTPQKAILDPAPKFQSSLSAVTLSLLLCELATQVQVQVSLPARYMQHTVLCT